MEEDASPKVIVKNTFIDICGADEYSSSDCSPSYSSPYRRNASAPPSPSRRDSGACFSDLEEEDNPENIPSYQWAPNSAIIAAEEPPTVGGSGDAALADRVPPWLRPAAKPIGSPGSPKRVTINRPSLSNIQSRPQLGKILRNNAAPGQELGFGLGPGFYPGIQCLDMQFNASVACTADAEQLPPAGSACPSGTYMGPSVLQEREVPEVFSEAPAYILGAACGTGVGQASCPQGVWPPTVDPAWRWHADASSRSVPPLAQQSEVPSGTLGDSFSASYRNVSREPLAYTGGLQSGGREPPGYPHVPLAGEVPGGLTQASKACVSVGRELETGALSSSPNTGKGNGKGTPWVMQGVLEQGIDENVGAAYDAAKAAKTSKTDVKTQGRVPMSGGGPKRTDYQKKYGGGVDDSNQPQPITTMMLRNIPCRKSQEEVMSHVDQKGFADRYDFFYLPRDVKFRSNLGYAFINFLTEQDARSFETELSGYRFSGSGSSKACDVVPAHVQGLMNNIAAFKRTEVMRSNRKPYLKATAAAADPAA